MVEHRNQADGDRSGHSRHTEPRDAAAASPKPRRPIRRKLAAAFIAVFALPLLVVAAYVRVWTERSLEARALADVDADCAQTVEMVRERLRGNTEDATFLSEAPGVRSLAKATLAGDSDAVEVWRANVESLFLSFARNRGIYDQIRYLDRTGQELVRIDSEGGRSWVVPPAQLQDKAHRDYFRRGLALSETQVYVSPLDLNREWGEIEVPYRPVIRYLVPVFVRERLAGLVVTNVLADPFLDQIRHYGGEGRGRQLLVNHAGFYLAHHDSGKEWGGARDLDTGENLRRDYERFASQILSGRGGGLEIGPDVACYEPILPDPDDQDRYWVLLQSVPRDVVLAPVRRFRLLLGGVFAASLLGAVTLSLYLSRRLSEPLSELARGAEALGTGNLDRRVTVRSGDEVEVLADRFNEMARRLRAARDQERLAVVGRMSAGIVHDIRNPLTSIRGFADLLATTEDPEERREFSQTVGQDADRILAMVQELLDFSRGQPAELRLETVSIGSFLSRIEPVLKRDTAASGIALDVRLSEDARVRVDPARMTRVLLNLVSNAVQAMGDTGGSVVVEAGRSGEELQMVVQDDGPGIPPEIRDSVFDPFVTQGKEQGTGLGLAICRQIVEAHGGTISLDSEVTRGARFVIRLPVADDENQQSRR